MSTEWSRALLEAADEVDGDERDIPEQRTRRLVAEYLREKAKAK